MIILTHSHQVFNLPYSMRMVPMFGQMGCQIFFVLSCFGLCLSYESREPKYNVFLWRRIKSISIGYWLTILITLFLAILSEKIFDKNIFETCTDKIKVLENVLFLHGLDPSTDGNNRVVRGGWFIGTLVLLYMLFPLLYKLYAKIKHRNIMIYGISLLCMSALVFLYVLDNIEVRKNSFFYFSFVNQLPSFILGFALYDWYKSKKQSYTCYLGAFLLLMSFIIFHIPSPLSYILLPFVFSLSFVNIYINTPPRCCRVNCCKRAFYEVSTTIKKYGEYSYAIYLIHSFFVFELSKLIISWISLPEWLIYILWLPILFFIVFYVGKVYNKLICTIKNCVYNY